MKVGSIIKSNQPREYEKLNKNRKKNNKKNRRGKENLSYLDVLDLMGTNRNTYKRKKGGAFTQK